MAGVYYVPDENALSAADQKRAMCLEIKTADPAAFEARLREFGVDAMHNDPSGRFYFQAPGGQVFRLAPLDGGV